MTKIRNALTICHLLIPHPLVFTVRATTCVYSDSLDWVINFTPTLRLDIARIMDPSN